MDKMELPNVSVNVDVDEERFENLHISQIPGTDDRELNRSLENFLNRQVIRKRRFCEHALFGARGRSNGDRKGKRIDQLRERLREKLRKSKEKCFETQDSSSEESVVGEHCECCFCEVVGGHRKKAEEEANGIVPQENHEEEIELQEIREEEIGPQEIREEEIEPQEIREEEIEPQEIREEEVNEPGPSNGRRKRRNRKRGRRNEVASI